MMLLPALMRCALASLAALMLASCSSGINIPIDKASIAFPRAILDLPQTELLEVQVYIDDEAEPSYRETNIDLGSDTVALKFDAPQGEHLFTLVFVYADPEIKRVDGSPWELARWHSAPVLVEPDAPVMLEVSSADYTYADDDGDGVSNLDELKARTRPDDPADVPVTNDPNLDLDTNPNSNPGPGPDPAPDPAPTPGPDPNPPVPPPPPDPKPVPPKDQGPPPDEPANPSEPEVPAFAAPVGLWSGTNERDENVLGMFYGTRLLISDPASIYDSAWSERGDGGFAGVA
ncbi:MAG: hypothetical protein LBV36_04115, partial [Chromatiales bacterium]|nr:hypothetical protein [Chromatiales bacterium]